jgi:hypothetical protein
MPSRSLILQWMESNTLRVLPCFVPEGGTGRSQSRASQQMSKIERAGLGRAAAEPVWLQWKSPAPENRAFLIVRIGKTRKQKQGKSVAGTDESNGTKVMGNSAAHVPRFAEGLPPHSRRRDGDPGLAGSKEAASRRLFGTTKVVP